MQYDRLDLTKNQIRVLHLKPSLQKNDVIVCNFSLATLDCETVTYEALSYVWGHRMHSNKIQLQEHPVVVTENLYVALQNLRSISEERILWIDALCINQSNQKERENQVCLMSSIYKRAQNVVVWLEEAWENCDLAINYLKQLGEDENLHINPMLKPSVRVKEKSMESVEVQNALKHFFSLPWWSRVWTVQEWVLAKQSVFQCGQFLLDGHFVRRGVRHYFHHQQGCCHKLDDPAQDSLFDSLIVVETLEYVRLLLGKISFPYILSQFRLRQATDTRDKVYGMLGLATGEYEHLFEPNYSYSVDKLFETSALTLIEQTKNLEILSHIPAFGPRNLNLPSFVPDWTSSGEHDGTYTRWLNWLGHLHLYNSCGGEPADIQIIAPGKIALKGIILDEIESTGSEFDSTLPQSSLHEMYNLSGVNLNPEELYCDTMITRNAAFWTTICGSIEYYLDPDRDNRPFYRRIPIPTDFSRFEKWAAWFSTRSKAQLDDDICSVHRPFIILTKGRKFTVTKRGYIGFCPARCRKGDVIAVMMGGFVPLVLRPDRTAGGARGSGPEGSYSLIGDSYIHGIMDGEALELSRKATGPLEYLVLS